MNYQYVPHFYFLNKCKTLIEQFLLTSYSYMLKIVFTTKGLFKFPNLIVKTNY